MANSTLTAEERNTVELLRAIVKDDLTPYYDTDFNLLRWLQGHNNDVDAVVRKLRCHLRFRKCWDLDNIHKRPRNHVIHSHWPYGLTGLSEKVANAIIYVEPSGTCDYWGMLQTYSVTDVMKARIHDLEMMLFEVMKQEKQTGYQATVVCVLDLQGLQFNKQLLSLVTGPMKCLSLFITDHYVELIKYFIFVNTPSFFHHLYRAVRPLLPERTANKAVILGADWRREILRYSSPSALPDYWNIDSDRTFTAHLKRPRKFDEEKYSTFSITSAYTMLSVGAGKTKFISISATAGAKLKWSIYSDGEFGFGIFFAHDSTETDETKMKMIYPQFYRVSAPSIVPMEETMLCEKTGVYKFWIDNKTAWLYTLKIHYQIFLQ
uniref:CRAL-TRIO domain-containing protein n=1 Tax=Plectus sambesii TaxID=2011161 RepID=A0A914VSQ6_9BILA